MTRTLTFSLFFLVMLGLVGAGHWYVWARLVRDAQLPAPWHRLLSGLVVLLALSIPAAFVLGRQLGAEVGKQLAFVAFGWMGVLFLLLLSCAAWDVAGLFGRGALRLFTDTTPLDPERRTFLARLGSGSLAAIGLGLSGFAVRSAVANVRVEHVAVTLARLPADLDGYTIVQLSDMHVSHTIGRAFVSEIVASVNRLKPDLIVITGDLVDGTPDALRGSVEPLGGLHSRDGVFFVTGNHEYYTSMSDGAGGADAWIAELERLGIRTLRNERVSIGDGETAFDLAGVDDWSAARFGGGHGAALAKALGGRDAARTCVLLAHQPKQVEEAARLGVDLQLSGHTHGGQIWPFGYLVRLQQPFVDGLHRLGDTLIYVSRGTGYWGPPMRLATPAEVTKVVLKARA